MKKRVVYRIQLTTDAKQRLLDLSDQLGITQIAMSSRLVEWFAAQPDLIQAAILGLYPDVIQQDVATLILKRLADGTLDLRTPTGRPTPVGPDGHSVLPSR